MSVNVLADINTVLQDFFEKVGGYQIGKKYKG